MVAPAIPLNPELEAQAYSVQEHADPLVGTLHYGGVMKRGPLLGAKGSRTREWHLRQYYHHDYNLQFRGGNTVLVKQAQSTPWEIVAKNAEPWQRMLMHADFGNWDRFIAKAVTDYSRHDAGAWIELIGPGDPRMPIAGPVAGMAVLDSLRVYPTGNPTYPAIYYDIKNRMHLMHKSRIVQLVDTEESEENLGGYGDCALSRAIGAVHREILMGRYVEQFLDDKPPPGIMIFGNLVESSIEAALKKMEMERNTDGGGDWGHTLRLYGAKAEVKPTAEFLFNQNPPAKFDFIEYSQLDAREIALALGIDMQDVWGELTTSGLGQGTQSQILKQKARGKGLGRLLKALERVINQALPDAVEFRWQYKDPEEDQEEAEKAQTWINVAQAAMASGVMDAAEARQLIANQVPGIQDVLLDANGNLKRLPDDDPKAEGEPSADDFRQVVNDLASPAPASPIEQIAEGMGIVPAQTTTGASSPVEMLAENLGIAVRAFDATADDFIQRFTSFVRVGQAQRFNAGVMRAAFRDELYQAGVKSYEDGLRAGGADPGEVTAIDQAERRRKAAEWLALQNGYINGFVNDVSEGKIAKAQIEMRAEMWVNKSLRSIYYVGLKDAAGEKKFKWMLGATKEHCKTCSMLNGQVHKLKDWLKSGYSPQCTCLECKGFQCDCRFVETNEAIRGRLPGSNGIGGLRDLFSGWLSRMAGKSIEVTFAAHPLALGRYLQRMAA